MIFTYKASSLLIFFKLSTASIIAANKTHALAVNITGTNVEDYSIPNVNPPVTLAFTHLVPGTPLPIDASSVYMCAIENLATVCRHNPRAGNFANPKIFSYGTVSIRLESLEPRTQPSFTYQAACATLRGLSEFMTINDWWYESFVDIVVYGTLVGSAQLWNPEGENSKDTVGMQIIAARAGSVATA